MNMIGVIATLKIKEGSGKDFEEVAIRITQSLRRDSISFGTIRIKNSSLIFL